MLSRCAIFVTAVAVWTTSITANQQKEDTATEPEKASLLFEGDGRQYLITVQRTVVRMYTIDPETGNARFHGEIDDMKYEFKDDVVTMTTYIANTIRIHVPTCCKVGDEVQVEERSDVGRRGWTLFICKRMSTKGKQLRISRPVTVTFDLSK